MVSLLTFTKVKNEKLILISFWSMTVASRIKKGMDLGPRPPNLTNDFLKLLLIARYIS